MKKYLLAAAAVTGLLRRTRRLGAGMAEPGKALNMVLLPKFLGILPFDQAHAGADEAAKELKNPDELQYLGPTADNSVAGQIEIITNATTQGVNAIMISNNAGDQIVPAAKAAQAKGIKVVTWDSPIPSAEGEDVFVAQVDFNETGKVMADMALDILGARRRRVRHPFRLAGRGQPERLDRRHEGRAQGSEVRQAQPGRHRLRQRPVGGELQPGQRPDRQVSEHEADHVADLGRHRRGSQGDAGRAACATRSRSAASACPSEMLAYTMNGCAPEFALWSFVDLGYLTYYTAYALASGALKAEDGAKFKAGRMGDYTITKDPTRDEGLRILMGPFSVYNKDNVEAAAK